MGDEVEHVTPKAPPLKRHERRRLSHWLVLTINLVIAIGCFVGAGALVFGQDLVNDQQKTAAIVSPSNTGAALSVPSSPSDSTEASTGESGQPAGTDGATTTTTEPFPVADPAAKNFLITGSDNGACADANSANPVDERASIGERSDTIMVMRVDPSTSQAAVLSFPRDLWVKIHGTNRRSRINSAFSLDEPQRLADTIYDNFFIPIDHYIQIDFCAFKVLVDSVDGVAVPFEYPARDSNTGLDVPQAGCYNFNGDAALAYVRSRHYQYFDPDTNSWKTDGTSDYGRIARQQDFLRRAVAKVLSRGVFNIEVAQGLIDVAKQYVVTDANLTLGKQLEFAGVLKNLDPNDIRTYQVEGMGTIIGGASVIEPRLEGDNMKAILAIFRGQAKLEGAPEQVFETATTVDFATTTTAAATTTAPTTARATTTSSAAGSGSANAATTTTRPPTTTSSTTTATTMPPTTVPPVTTTTLPAVEVTQTSVGIFPPKDQNC